MIFDMPSDMARCVSNKCKSRHRCKRWIYNRSKNAVWFSNFDPLMAEGDTHCQYIVEADRE